MNGRARKTVGGTNPRLVNVKKKARPVTLAYLKKNAIKKDRTGLVQCREMEFIVAQSKDAGEKWKFIFDGSAMVDGKYVADFLLGGGVQKKGQLVYLQGVSQQDGDKSWSPYGVQVCDGNIVAWNCSSGTMVFKA